VQLRTATPDDAEALAGLVVAVAHHAYADLDPVRVDALDPEEEAGEWRSRLGDPAEHLARIGSAGGHTVAASCWHVPRRTPGAPVSSATLTHLMVHPAAQNAGVGSVLLADAEETLRGLGGASARLSLHREAWWAARFLASRGWERDEATPSDGPTGDTWRRSL
jgi:GNAT superfamily N-acetyltransferase